MPDRAQYKRWWLEVDPEIRHRVVGTLRDAFPADEQQKIRELAFANPEGWWAEFHLLGGMSIRNFLRTDVGVKDKDLPARDDYYGPGTDVRNWDDYYIQAIEEAVGALDYSDDANIVLDRGDLPLNRHQQEALEAKPVKPLFRAPRWWRRIFG